MLPLRSIIDRLNALDHAGSRGGPESPRERIRREREAIADWHRRKPERDRLRRRFWRGNEDPRA